MTRTSIAGFLASFFLSVLGAACGAAAETSKASGGAGQGATGGGSPASSGTDGSSEATGGAGTGDGGATPASSGADASSGAMGGGDGGGSGGLAPWPSTTERCDGALDEDDDGLVDEDCPSSMFAGVFVPAGVGLTDPSVLDAIESDAERTLPVVQTYRSTSVAGAANAKLDLAAIWARGATPHLNVEPLGYAPSQFGQKSDDPELSADVAAMATAVAEALEAQPGGSLLLTFAAEMNGDWTDWGCLQESTFISLYRWAHGVFDAALAARAPAIDPRRVRWVFGPNNVSSAGCGSPADYYPGHAYTDYLGMSAYRSGTQSTASAVLEPAHALLDDLELTSELRADRFIVLQTGTRDEPGDDRDAWIVDLFAVLAADPIFRGAIYFDAADWAIATSAGGVVTKQVGYQGLVDAIAATPPTDARLEGAFDPYFWDVGVESASYPEIQSLRAAGLTSGCDADPPRFCPRLTLSRRDAAVLLGRAFAVEPDLASAPLFGDVTESDASFGLVQALALAEVLAGCSEESFCPDDTILRGDLGRALVRLAEVAPTAPSSSPFDDVGLEGEDAAIQALGAVGQIDGCEAGSFCAGSTTTREVGARWIVRVAGIPEGGRLTDL